MAAALGSRAAAGAGAGRLALVLAGMQALAAGAVLWAALPGRWRWGGVGLGGVLLAGIGLGGTRSPEAGLLAASGLMHAALYGAMLVVFGASLLPGREAVITRLARRINPHFRAGMVPYTRAVTAGWCLFAAGQLVGSAVLLGVGWLGAWALLVGGGHAGMAMAFAVGEFAVRTRRFPGEHTGFVEMVRGIRATGSGRHPHGGTGR